MAAPIVDILMYHSIAEGPHPTQISPAVFADQIAAIAESGTPVITLDDFLEAQENRLMPHQRALVVTFDDAFADFGETAWPILKRHGVPATVYVPTDHVGGRATWTGAAEPASIMDWEDIEALSADGVTFASHSVTHPALDALSPAAAEAEIRISRAELEDRLGREVRHFAPPYGRTNPETSRLIARHYRTSVSTRLASAGLETSRLDLPRLEMYYFRDVRRWQNHLAGLGGRYLAIRKMARAVRQAVYGV